LLESTWGLYEKVQIPSRGLNVVSDTLLSQITKTSKKVWEQPETAQFACVGLRASVTDGPDPLICDPSHTRCSLHAFY
jgi:hypothetical protein